MQATIRRIEKGLEPVHVFRINELLDKDNYPQAIRYIKGLGVFAYYDSEHIQATVRAVAEEGYIYHMRKAFGFLGRKDADKALTSFKTARHFAKEAGSEELKEEVEASISKLEGPHLPTDQIEVALLFVDMRRDARLDLLRHPDFLRGEVRSI